MEHPEPNRSQIRGKDLAGAIKVMPMGLDAAIKKRVSGEFKSEQRGGTVSFSNSEQTSTSMKRESKQMQSFEEEVPETRAIASPFQQAGFKAAPMQQQLVQKQQQTSSMQQSSSIKQQQSNISSFDHSSSQQLSSSSSMATSHKSMMTSSSTSSKSVSMQSSSTMQKDFGEAASEVTFGGETFEDHQEIGQDKLKTQLVSCISDLEKDRDFVDFNKENKPINLSSPPRTFSPVPAFPSKQESTFSPPPKQDMFSPPPLEAMEPPKAAPLPMVHPEPQQPLAPLPVRNGVQNGFSDFLGTGSKTVETFESSSYQQQQQSSSIQQVMNGSFEETGSVQGSSSSSSLLQKIMTPANPEYDTGSLKRRDPRKMFTDSSFYSAKHHPTVADQVEMAHKLSSAMFNEKNKSTKGQQMFLSRVQNAGEEELEQEGEQNRVPNLKHVMNPEGRMLEWGDVTKEELPNVEMMAVHAAPNLNTPDPIAESLNAEAGKGGELFAKRRKRAENWVVDEASLGQAKPSAFADKFVTEQTERQVQFAQEAHEARQAKAAVQSQQQMIQQTESQQQQNFAKQQFTEQQLLKQEQSQELRRQQEIRMQQEIDFPDNFQHTNLRAQSHTPSLDLGCHNVQGINVWANTAPRGWGGSTPGPQGLPKSPAKQQGPPELSVCPATPVIEQEQLQFQQQETLRMQQEQEMMRQEQERITMQQQQLEIQRQKEEQQRVQLEYEQLQQQKEIERQQEMQRQQQEMERQQEMQRQQQEMERIERIEMERQQQEMMRQEEEARQQELMRQQEQQRQQQMELERQQEIQRLEQQQQQQMQQQIQQQEQMKQQQQQQQLQRQQEEQEQLMRQQQEQQMIQQRSMQQSSQFSSSSTGGSTQQQQQQEQSFTQQQSSTSFSSTTKHQEVYEATTTERSMTGYQVKGSEDSTSGRLSARARDSGVFGGIGGDDNSLVDADFDYKKHSVKDLAQHFAAVKPKAQIPLGILPEQKMYNGEQGPALNYLGGKQDFAEQKQIFVKKEVSAEDIEASKQAYEMKKKQQLEQAQKMQNQNQSSSSVTSSSTVTMREKKTEETRSMQESQRKSSMSSALLMDPAAAHAQAGIIDPSAILRGDGSNRASIVGTGRSSVPGETEIVASKWDNHNAIARGWGGVKANYHPVTFRGIYNVESQTTQNL